MRLVPVAKDAWRFVIPLVLVGGFLVTRSEWLYLSSGILLLLAALFCLYFFRDFDRNTVSDENLIYSPGDGTVMDVAQVHDANKGSFRLIRIFLSVLDGPFVNYDGVVNKVDEEKGKVKVLISIFGRETPIELDFTQVKKK